MNMKQALHEMGVSDEALTPAEKGALDRDGFLSLPGILAPEQAQKMGARLDELVAQGVAVRHQEGVDTLDDVIHKDPMFEVCFTHPRLLAAVSHVLGSEFKLHSVNSRIALPGYGQQVRPGGRLGAGATNSTPTGTKLWSLAIFTYATQYGHWWTSRKITGRPGLSRDHTAVASCRLR